MTTTVVGTAGHVDHGKSTLVWALTGTDPDRLAEEKRRGLTIELGFARLRLPSGADVHLVDVPGHSRFIKTMLAGVGAVDAALLVVAATEGWKPQTEEHLRILDLLGVRSGLVVVTMADRVDGDSLELAHLAVDDAVKGTFLEEAAHVSVDSITGRGISALVDGLEHLVSDATPAADSDRPRLWVDRSFSRPGAGTVATGTLTGGGLAVGDELAVMGRRGVSTAKVRGVQSFGDAQERLAPGCRAAVNLTGIHHTAIERGDALVRPAQWHETTVVDASLQVLPSSPRPVTSSGAHVAYIGSGEHPARLRVIRAASIAPGELGLVRLRLPRALPLVPGDRYVLRDSGSGTTVGGGEVLDVAPTQRLARARPDRSVERVIAERGWVDATELERLTGQRLAPTVGSWVVHPPTLATARTQLLQLIDAAPLGLELAALSERERALVRSDDGITVQDGRARRTGHAAVAPLSHGYLERLSAQLFAPPQPEETGVSPRDVRELIRRGLAVRADGIVFAARAVDEAAAVAARLLATSPTGFSASQMRRALGTTRRFTLPLLAILDQSGITRRRGDLRIGGPRLPVI